MILLLQQPLQEAEVLQLLLHLLAEGKLHNPPNELYTAHWQHIERMLRILDMIENAEATHNDLVCPTTKA